MNTTNQPIGFPVPNWKPASLPPRKPIDGQYCKLEPLDPGHTESLFAANNLDKTGSLWTYLPYGPFKSFAEYQKWVQGSSSSNDPLFFSVIQKPGNKPVGVASLMRIDRENGVIEIGHLCFSPLLQKTIAGTESLFLLIDKVFELGYRRCEWKCNSLNEPSKKAALRLGFSFEGIFRQSGVVKGHNRDTAWFSIIDSEWPNLKAAIEKWLKPENFDEQGHQRERLLHARQKT
jgi:RimJ/RimL family protein N-acetyltransferase